MTKPDYFKNYFTKFSKLLIDNKQKDFLDIIKLIKKTKKTKKK